jgi:hypothetical protein
MADNDLTPLTEAEPSREQQDIAERLGLTIRGEPFEVVAAMIRDAVADAVGAETPCPSTAKQRRFAAEIGVDVQNATKRVASARIDEALKRKNAEALGRLRLKPGDAVVQMVRFEYEGTWHVSERQAVVSSLGKDGRVYFKGGNGRSAWPTQLKRVENR